MEQADLMYQKMQEHLDNENWAAAKEQGLLILNKIDVHHVDTCVGMLLAQAETYSIQRLQFSKIPIDDNPYFKIAMEYGDEALRERLTYIRRYILGHRLAYALIYAKISDTALLKQALHFLEDTTPIAPQYEKEINEVVTDVRHRLNAALESIYQNCNLPTGELYFYFEPYEAYLDGTMRKRYMETCQYLAGLVGGTIEDWKADWQRRRDIEQREREERKAKEEAERIRAEEAAEKWKNMSFLEKFKSFFS